MSCWNSFKQASFFFFSHVSGQSWYLCLPGLPHPIYKPSEHPVDLLIYLSFLVCPGAAAASTVFESPQFAYRIPACSTARLKRLFLVSSFSVVLLQFPHGSAVSRPPSHLSSGGSFLFSCCHFAHFPLSCPPHSSALSSSIASSVTCFLFLLPPWCFQTDFLSPLENTASHFITVTLSSFPIKR